MKKQTTTVTSTTTTTTTSTSTTTVTTTTTAQDVASAYWSFDNNALELYNTSLDGAPSATPSYVTSFTGYGAAIATNPGSNRYVYITPTVLPLNSRSFTIEAWIYPTVLSTSTDYGIFGQCQSRTTNLCFHFIVRSQKLFCGFFNNDLSGVTTLVVNTWYHVACTYDLTTMTQQLWLDGISESSRSATSYQGLWGNTTIGAAFQSGSATIFQGYIDNVRFEARAKNSTEILQDATLHVYYSFDGGSLNDNGPNGINGTAYGNLSSSIGRVNQAMQFNGGPYVSYSYAPYFYLGISNQSHSFALWAKPTGSYKAETLLFVGKFSPTWCVHFLVMNAIGQLTANSWNGGLKVTSGPVLPLNTWTHIGYTYSTTNGVRLYINGSQYSSTGPFTFTASGASMPIVLGGDEGRTGCTPGFGGTFSGELDEFYAYRRELTASEILALADP